MKDWTGAEYIKEVLQNQCRIANLKFEDIDFESDTWYSDSTWTTEQETKFKIWVIDYLKNNIKARKQLMTYPSKTKYTLEKWFDSYNLMYGFRIKNDEV